MRPVSDPELRGDTQNSGSTMTLLPGSAKHILSEKQNKTEKECMESQKKETGAKFLLSGLLPALVPSLGTERGRLSLIYFSSAQQDSVLGNGPGSPAESRARPCNVSQS